MSKPRPTPGVSYAGGLPEFMSQSRLEAVRSLAKSWGVTETRAADLLADPAEYAIECRSRRTITGREARRETERRYAPGAR